MRPIASTSAVAAVLLATLVSAQQYGVTTYTSAADGQIYTAALDANGNPVAPAVATPAAGGAAAGGAGGAGRYTEVDNGQTVIYSNDGTPFTTLGAGAGAGAGGAAAGNAAGAGAGGAAAGNGAGAGQGGGAAPVAAGGGGGTAVTQATLQSISGYNPPPSSQLPSPTNFASGSVIGTAQIPGWSSVVVPNNGQSVLGGGGNKFSASTSQHELTKYTAGIVITLATAVGSMWMVL